MARRGNRRGRHARHEFRVARRLVPEFRSSDFVGRARRRHREGSRRMKQLSERRCRKCGAPYDTPHKMMCSERGRLATFNAVTGAYEPELIVTIESVNMNDDGGRGGSDDEP